jgi:hypothetical protein
LFAAAEAGAEGGGAITEVITASRCTTAEETCAAPLAVHFHVRETTCTTAECDDDRIENEAFHDASKVDELLRAFHA